MHPSHFAFHAASLFNLHTVRLFSVSIRTELRVCTDVFHDWVVLEFGPLGRRSLLYGVKAYSTALGDRLTAQDVSTIWAPHTKVIDVTSAHYIRSHCA